MAIDTRDKRASVLGTNNYSVLSLPLADGGLNAGDREHTAALYRGIAAITVTPRPYYYRLILIRRQD